MSDERKAWFVNGWLVLVGVIALAIWLFQPPVAENLTLRVTVGALLLLSVRGFHIIQPNRAMVFTLLGSYMGSVRQNGFIWTIPIFSKRDISLRLQNLEGPILKVNDKTGNPIEIGAIVFWRVDDTARAVFDVDNVAKFVELQSETSLRHLANSFAYDSGDHQEVTLRGGAEHVSETFHVELEQRLSKAGVKVDEARIAHLAYSPEIAAAMLRRQQAAAVIAARQQIVSGAVGIVSTALKELTQTGTIELDDERKAAMVSNLLVVLCSESQVSPVVNAGTLYT